MRSIEQTGQFRRDYKRKSKSPHRETLASEFVAIVTALANDQPLAEKHRDHALIGDWKDHRDCHIQARSGVDLPQAQRQCLAARPSRVA
jgi:mRNA interferase YafQ